MNLGLKKAHFGRIP